MCAEDAVCKPQQAAASLWYCGVNQQRCGKAATNIGCPDDTLVLQDVSASNASQPGSSAFPPSPVHTPTHAPLLPAPAAPQAGVATDCSTLVLGGWKPLGAQAHKRWSS